MPSFLRDGCCGLFMAIFMGWLPPTGSSGAEGIHLEGLILDVRHEEIARLSRLMPSPFWVRSFVPKLEYFGVASAAS